VPVRERLCNLKSLALLLYCCSPNLITSHFFSRSFWVKTMFTSKQSQNFM